MHCMRCPKTFFHRCGAFFSFSFFLLKCFCFLSECVNSHREVPASCTQHSTAKERMMSLCRSRRRWPTWGEAQLHNKESPCEGAYVVRPPCVLPLAERRRATLFIVRPTACCSFLAEPLCKMSSLPVPTGSYSKIMGG